MILLFFILYLDCQKIYFGVGGKDYDKSNYLE